MYPVDDNSRLTERNARDQGLVEFAIQDAKSLGLLRRPNQVQGMKSFGQKAPNFAHNLMAGTRDNIKKLRNINLPKIKLPPPTPVIPAGRWVPG